MLIVLPLMIPFVIGCANKPVVEYCEPVTLYQDRYIPVPEQLTEQVEVVDLPSNFDLIDLGVAYKAQRVRAMQCNGRLEDIARIHSE